MDSHWHSIASTIDPLSVRFGPRDTIWVGIGGTAEAHDQGHGHGKGMLFHFVGKETELTTGDSEACIKGTWFDADAAPHTFFGCDGVMVK